MCVNFYSAPCNLASKWTTLYSMHKKGINDGTNKFRSIILTTTCSASSITTISTDFSREALTRFSLCISFFHSLVSLYWVIRLAVACVIAFALYLLVCNAIMWTNHLYEHDQRSCAPIHTNIHRAQLTHFRSFLYDFMLSHICRSVQFKIHSDTSFIFLYRYVMRIHLIYIPITFWIIHYILLMNWVKKKNVRGTHTLTWQIVLHIDYYSYILWNFIRRNRKISFRLNGDDDDVQLRCWYIVWTNDKKVSEPIANMSKVFCFFVLPFFLHSVDALRAMWLKSAIEFPLDLFHCLVFNCLTITNTIIISIDCTSARVFHNDFMSYLPQQNCWTV